MKFIFPQNYQFKNKLFGMIDYSTAIFDVLWCLLIYGVTIPFSDISVKCIIFIICCFPVLLISLVGIQHENFLYVAYYFIKFLCNRKVYLYKK